MSHNGVRRAYRENELCATRIQLLRVMRSPRSGGESSFDSSLKLRSFSPSAKPSAFMTRLSKEIVAHASLVVYVASVVRFELAMAPNTHLIREPRKLSIVYLDPGVVILGTTKIEEEYKPMQRLAGVGQRNGLGTRRCSALRHCFEVFLVILQAILDLDSFYAKLLDHVGEVLLSGCQSGS